jgi:regulator of protease activity HflC (stomatin/prohibitin superfamily)
MDPITMLAIGSALYGGLSSIFNSEQATGAANAATATANAQEQQIFTEISQQTEAQANAPNLTNQVATQESLLNTNPNFNAAHTILQTPMSMGFK